MGTEDRLHVFCGKMAAGKSTLSCLIADEIGGIRLSEDELLLGLYSGKVVDVPTYVQYSNQVKQTLRPHFVDLLKHQIILVLDFPANTKKQRQWFLDIAQDANVTCALHILDCSDEICLSRLGIRASENPERKATDTAEMFAAIAQYYEQPTADESFNLMYRSSDLR